jgi:uncharacterized hydantoinase/oxoprolinase family protein
MTFEKSLKEKERALNAIHSASGWYALLIQDNPSVFSINSVDTATDTITVTGHDFVNGHRVTLANSGGTIQGGITASTEYRVIQSATNTFKLCTENTYNATTKTGTPIDITSTGTGITTITEQPFNAKDDFDILARKEVNYYGSGRQELTIPSATINYTAQQAAISVNANFTPSTGSITYRYFAVVSGGISTTGNNQGVIAGFEDYLFTNTIDNTGKTFQYSAII